MEASWLHATRRLRGYVVHRLPRLVVPVHHRAGGVINKGEESVSNLYTGFAVHFLQISYHSSTSQVWSPLLGSARGEIEIRWEVRGRSADSDCSAVHSRGGASRTERVVRQVGERVELCTQLLDSDIVVLSSSDGDVPSDVRLAGLVVGLREREQKECEYFQHEWGE